MTDGAEMATLLMAAMGEVAGLELTGASRDRLGKGYCNGRIT